MKYVTPITFLALAAIPGAVSAMCFADASSQYGVPEALLRATATVESRNNPAAIGKNSNGTSDLGIMQINSTWLPTLSKWGITRQALLTNPCINIKVGAWIMSKNIRRHGYNWNAIGAYNVGCQKLAKNECDKRRSRYSGKIYSALMKENRPALAQAQAETVVREPGISTVSFSQQDPESTRGDS